jgi:hypothetical protein
MLSAAALAGGLALLAACGESGDGATPLAFGTPSGTYSVTVTATAGAQTAATTVFVIVEQFTFPAVAYPSTHAARFATHRLPASCR